VKWRSEVVLAVTLFGVAPRVAIAQATAPSPLCACFVSKPPGVITPAVPGTPGTVPPPETPGETPGATDPGDDDDRAPWAFLGAAGLALLSGVPFGGAGVQGPLFGTLPTSPGGPAPTQVAAAPTTPVERPGVVELPPSPQAPRAGRLVPGAGGGTPTGPVRSPVDSILDTPRAGRVAPKTATHLPLFGALGVLMTGAGLLLARRGERQRRRRRRLVAT
jgi:hypothetical protein